MDKQLWEVDYYAEILDLRQEIRQLKLSKDDDIARHIENNARLTEKIKQLEVDNKQLRESLISILDYYAAMGQIRSEHFIILAELKKEVQI